MKGLRGGGAPGAAGERRRLAGCVFEGSSWEFDDRIVFGNLRVAWSALSPRWMTAPGRKRFLFFQRASLYLYFTFSSRESFKGTKLFPTLRFFVV